MKFGFCKLFHNAWRKIVYWVGDIRRISHFPFITWHVHEHLISYEETLQALEHIKPGDIGIHRDRGYLSNVAIPGFMKHGWIHLSSDTIVEAVSEGVVKRSSIYPIHSDYTIILRPKKYTPDDVDKALNKANTIVGQQYDVDFCFDIEKEVQMFGGKEIEAARENIAKWDGGFSCTEVVAFSYFHLREQLHLYRKERRGKMVITADDFLNNCFEIVWCSKSVTSEVAKSLGLHEEGVDMIKRYWEKENAI